MGCCLHEGVGDRHGGDDHDVHEEGEGDDALVEAEELIVFLQAVVDEVFFDHFEEVPVEQGVDDEVYYFFDAVPDFVDVDVAGRMSKSYMMRSREFPYRLLVCSLAGIQMLNTLMLIAVTITAVQIIIILENRRSGTMIRIRLMIICRRSCTWIHQQVTSPS